MSSAAVALHRELVEVLLVALDDSQVQDVSRPFADAERRSFSYLPGERAGLALHELPRDLQQQVLRLVAAALRPHAFAQVAAVMALEDVLDITEGGTGRRHRGDYWITLFDRPGDDCWGWRFEGHHVSVNVAVVDATLRAVPLFLGANPAAVLHRSTAVTRPLASEEDVARTLLMALDADGRRRAVLSTEAPGDILSGHRPQVEDPVPEGVCAGALHAEALELLQELVGVYLDRLPESSAAATRAALAGPGWQKVYFQWRGSAAPGSPHYYALTGPRLLVEYDNTQNGANHVHSVLRDPAGDFGADLLAEHYARHH